MIEYIPCLLHTIWLAYTAIFLCWIVQTSMITSNFLGDFWILFRSVVANILSFTDDNFPGLSPLIRILEHMTNCTQQDSSLLSGKGTRNDFFLFVLYLPESIFVAEEAEYTFFAEFCNRNRCIFSTIML